MGLFDIFKKKQKAPEIEEEPIEELEFSELNSWIKKHSKKLKSEEEKSIELIQKIIDQYVKELKSRIATLNEVNVDDKSAQDNYKTIVKSGREKYVELLEEAVIQTLKKYDIHAGRLKSASGVWLDPEVPGKARKICAIGVRASRGVTMHGFAFNVNTDLSFYQLINPCGFTDKGVTSMQNELAKPVNINDVKNILRDELIGLFRMHAR